MPEFTNELDAAKAIKNACVQYLARREHSQQELLQKVSAKGFSRYEIMAVLEKLVEHGLQSNARFAESYARSRIHKGFGPLRIQAELQQRGAGDCCFEMAVENIAGSWQQLLEQVYRKKYSVDSTLDIKEKIKRTRFLLQRGFPGDMVQCLFRELSL